MTTRANILSIDHQVKDLADEAADDYVDANTWTAPLTFDEQRALPLPDSMEDDLRELTARHGYESTPPRFISTYIGRFREIVAMQVRLKFQ